MNRALISKALMALEHADSWTDDLTVHYEVAEAIEALRQELEKPEHEIYGYVSEHNCTGPFKHQFHLTLETIYPDNCKSITPVYTKGTTNV